MRVAGSEVRLGYGGGGGGGAKELEVAEAGDGCSTSRRDSPLPSSVRVGGGPAADLEPHGLPTTSSCSSSNASTGPEEEEDEDRGLEAVKGERRRIHLRGETNNPVLRSAGECQGQRHPLGAVLFHGRKGWKQRPASLDFGCPSADRSSTHSPGFLVSGMQVVNKGLCVSPEHRSPVLSNPGTSRRGAAVVGHSQSWNSDRVPLASNCQRRHPGSSMALPYNHGRTLPSKWEDAERWIFSPKPSDAIGRTSLPQPRRPKSKSGPLGPPGRFGALYSSVSSPISLFDSGGARNPTVNSPFLSGVLQQDHVCGGSNRTGIGLGGASDEDISNGYGSRHGQVNGRHSAVWLAETCHQLDSAVQLLPSSQEYTLDEQLEIEKGSSTSNTSVILRKDVATQTSPELSRSSSPNMRPSFSRSLSVQRVKELESYLSKLEIKDVQMDDRVTLTRWSKKHVSRGSEKNSTNIIKWKRKTTESKSSTWEVTETAKCISKIEGEEAEMTAWENMQKAKGEAEIQKLVVKLEKKRLYSLERIFNTFRSGNRKTQVVSRTTTANHDQQISRTVRRTSHLSKNSQMSSLSGCFTCHAF